MRYDTIDTKNRICMSKFGTNLPKICPILGLTSVLNVFEKYGGGCGFFFFFFYYLLLLQKVPE